MKRFDVVVIGCGAMGSSATYNLARRGLKVLALERFGLNHDLGSSHGMTRMIRLAYFEDPRYVPMLRRAFAAWDELERSSGSAIIKRTGGLMIGKEGGDLVRGVMKSVREHALPHRLLDAREAMDVLRILRLEEDFTAVYDDNAGFLFPDNCIASYVRLGKEEGASVQFAQLATGWKRSGRELEVVTEKEKYSADRLVFAAGPWTGKLLPGLLPLVCERQVQFWFRPPVGEGFSAGKAPVFIMEKEGPSYFYGIPDVGRGAKVARSHGGTATDPDMVDRRVTETDISPVRDFMAGHLPSMDPRPIASATCMYTNTPDGNFVIDFHPDDRNVIIVSACSGHGFKFASVVGEVVADLVIKGRSEFDISFLGIARFRKRAGTT